MNGPALIKYALYGVLGMELAFSGVNIIDSPFRFLGIILTVVVIENLGIIQSRRF
jgi:hypothetical protein